MKKTKIFACALTLAMSVGITANAYSDVRVYVNGMRINENIILDNDLTYIPLRAVGEAMGAHVEWDGNSRIAYIEFSEDDAIAKIVEDVSPSVVTIVGNYDDDGDVYTYNAPTAHGSGVIYKSNGYILTNAHVVEDIKNLTVVLSDGTLLPGTVLYSDKPADLAVVKIDKVGLKPISMADEATVLSGKTAIAIGTPISLSMRNTVTKGIVSGCDVALPDSHYKLLQTDAAINPGNSGGPLLNVKGELIGINSSKFVSSNIDNIGFAIPVDTVKTAIEHFENYGRIMRPEFDFSFEDSWEVKIGLPTKKGVTVKNSTNAVIKSGDIITAVNGIEVHSTADINEAIKDTYIGNTIVIQYTRNGVSAVAEI